MSIDYDEPLFIDSGDPEKNPVKRGRATTKPTEKPHKVTLEEALTTLKALGFTINLPTSEEDKARQDETSTKLGFKHSRVKSSKSLQPARILTGVLHTTHRVGGDTYGPGELQLPREKADLFRSLLQQDQACVRAHMDTTQYTNTARCYLIETKGDIGTGVSKKEVSEAVFNSDALTTAVTVSNIDIAGYNPAATQNTF